LRKERRLRVFENMVLRNIFGLKRDEITGEWRKLHSEGLTRLYSLPNIIRLIKSKRMRWAWHAARMWKRKSAYRVLAWKPERKTLLGGPKLRWEDNIKMELQEVGWGGGWTGLICVIIGRSGGLCKRGIEPSGSIIMRRIS